jgi:hypothetical protein
MSRLDEIQTVLDRFYPGTFVAPLPGLDDVVGVFNLSEDSKERQLFYRFVTRDLDQYVPDAPPITGYTARQTKESFPELYRQWEEKWTLLPGTVFIEEGQFCTTPLGLTSQGAIAELDRTNDFTPSCSDLVNQTWQVAA